jgi:hypothetical protein
LSNHLWTELYVLVRDRLPAILVPDSDGVPTLVDPQPVVLRARYIPLDGLEQALPIARTRLNNPQCGLLLGVPCPDGPPNRSGLHFTFQQEIPISWQDDRTPHHGARARKFLVTTGSGQDDWLGDARLGRLGYFVTGDAGDTSLWRVTRLESDAFDRFVFTLAPVRIAGNLPASDFSTCGDSLLATELTQQYQDLCRSVTQHAYRDVVTKARNIVEGAVAARLRGQNHPASGKLFEDLKQVDRLLCGETRDACGWTDLEYHVCHKIRLLHGWTHVNQAAQTGPLRPEFALTVVEDLAYLLTAWGLVRGK